MEFIKNAIYNVGSYAPLCLKWFLETHSRRTRGTGISLQKTWSIQCICARHVFSFTCSSEWAYGTIRSVKQMQTILFLFPRVKGEIVSLHPSASLFAYIIPETTLQTPTKFGACSLLPSYIICFERHVFDVVFMQQPIRNFVANRLLETYVRGNGPWLPCVLICCTQERI
jgi:hypothetical protein